MNDTSFKTLKTLSARKKRAAKIGKILDALYPQPPIPLDHKDPYTLLIAVLLSAQCTDVRVNQVTPALFSLADTPEKMAALKVYQIKEIIRPCGLSPTKSKNIHRLSEILLNEYDAQVPKKLGVLESLPGVGHKTASVVVSQAFGQPAFPVDTHIWRLAKLWGLSEAKNVKQVEKDLKELWEEESWNRRHLQIIFYGREHSPARGAQVEKTKIWVYFRHLLN